MSKQATQRDGDDSRQATQSLLTTRQAAERLGVHERTVRRAIARGEIPARRVRGGYRIAAEALERIALPRPVARLVALPPASDGRAPLPRPLTPFVGRDDDVAAVTALLRDRAIRLVTLTGPGGIGKTRLAIEAAAALKAGFPDGVAFVSLATVPREALVLQAIAAAVGLKESGRHDLGRRVGAFLRSRRLLLVLDNCEHLSGMAAQIAELVRDAPQLSVLLTSRAPLRISGEREQAVPALSLPAANRPFSPDSVLASDAGRLFVERARAADATFTLDAGNAVSITEICTRLDGLPLAIELAAARTKLLPPRMVLERLTPALPLLSGGPRDLAQRQRTLRDTIAWSYDLLTPAEQGLFRALSVFTGGFSLEAAEAVGSRRSEVGGTAEQPTSDFRLSTSDAVLDLVAALLDQSLVLREDGPLGGPRFRMLETIREFGQERLAAADEDWDARDRHARYLLGLARSVQPAASTRSSLAPLAQLAAEQANIRAALEWLDTEGSAEDFLGLVAALRGFWFAFSYLREGRGWVERALARIDLAAPPDRGRILVEYAELLARTGDREQAEPYFGEAIPLLGALTGPIELAIALIAFGATANYAGNYAAAEPLFEEALALGEGLSDAAMRAAVTGSALANLSVSARGRGDLDLAAKHSEEALRRYRGHDLDLAETHTLMDLGDIAHDQRNYRLAVERYRACVDRTGERGDMRLVADALAGIASAATAWGQTRPALLLFGAASALRERVGTAILLPLDVATVDRDLAALRASLGEQEADAIMSEGRALSLAAAVGIAASVQAPAAEPSIGDTPRVVLTSREREVLRLIVSRHTDREIADVLFLSLHTVHWHVGRILAKLGVASRRQAATLAEADRLV